MVDSLLVTVNRGRNPLRALKEISKLIRFKDYKMLKTGSYQKHKKFIGEEQNLKLL